MKELITIYDENMNAIADKDRDEIHRMGFWHETAHCWFLERFDDEIYMYLQKRAASKKDFPSMYDITAAGHIDAGELLEAALAREVREEVGIIIRKEDVNYVGMVKVSNDFGEFIDNEFCQLFFYLINDEIAFDLGEEVEKIVRVKFSEFEKLIYEIKSEIQAYKLEEDVIEDLLRKEDICPTSNMYYEFLFTEIRKLLSS